MALVRRACRSAMREPICSVATRRNRKQYINEARDCSEIEAVSPPVDMSTVCQRLAAVGDTVRGGGGGLVGDFSDGGLGYL